MGNQMTVRDVLAATLAILGSIKVPMGEYNEIGTPIRHAMDNLGFLIGVMDKSAEAEKKTEGADDGREADPE